MNKYIKDDKIIDATEKAYELIYSKQGYKPYVPSCSEQLTKKDCKKERLNIKNVIKKIRKNRRVIWK